MSDQKCLTTTIPEAGKLCFDLSRNGSYAAAERGEIPYVRVGRLKRVPINWIRRTLGIDQPDEEGAPR